MFGAFFALFSMVVNMGIGREIADIQNDITIEQGKTRKQQAEFDEYTMALPLAQKELDEIGPKAAAATALIDALKAERKELRSKIATIKALQEKAAELQGELDRASDTQP